MVISYDSFDVLLSNAAISRKGVGKSTRGNPERYFGWFRIHYFQRSLKA